VNSDSSCSGELLAVAAYIVEELDRRSKVSDLMIGDLQNSVVNMYFSLFFKNHLRRVVMRLHGCDWLSVEGAYRCYDYYFDVGDPNFAGRLVDWVVADFGFEVRSGLVGGCNG